MFHIRAMGGQIVSLARDTMILLFGLRDSGDSGDLSGVTTSFARHSRVLFWCMVGPLGWQRLEGKATEALPGRRGSGLCGTRQRENA